MKLKKAKNKRPKNMGDGRLQIQLASTEEFFSFPFKFETTSKFYCLGCCYEYIIYHNLIYQISMQSRASSSH